MDLNLMLYDACCRDDVDTAKEAVRQGARISYTHYGRPLRVACQNDSINVFNWLVAKGVSLENYDYHIFAVAEYGYCDLFDRLMELGIDPNGPSYITTWSPLSIAVKSNRTDIIDRLLALNVDVNKGCPLTYARNLVTADKLIVYGANVSFATSSRELFGNS